MDAKPLWGRVIRATRDSFGRQYRRRTSLGFATTELTPQPRASAMIETRRRKNNFRKGVNVFFDKSRTLLSLTQALLYSMTFPVCVMDGSAIGDERARYAAPVNVHLPGMKKVKQVLAFPNCMGKVVNLDPTDAGRAVFKLANSMGPGSLAGFCVGHAPVVSVDRFTEIVDQSRRLLAQVTFTERTDDEAWTRTGPSAGS